VSGWIQKPLPPKVLDDLTELFKAGPLSACVIVKGEMLFLGTVRDCLLYVENNDLRKFKLLHLRKVFAAEQANQ